jgi:enamine deaminase RidA (YjgF/YER057c/UK114 family)
MRGFFPLPLAFCLFLGSAAPCMSAEYLSTNERQKARAYSPAVITEGGRIVWLAGQTGIRDEQGKDLSGSFEAQARQIFRSMDRTLQQTGGSLANLVTMTVFINDVRLGDRFVEIRKEMFPNGNYPGSALITVSAFAQPGMMIEIQGVAVMGDRCGNENPCLPR